MKKEDIRKLILEVLLECIEDTSNYAPDKWEDDFKRAIERKAERILDWR